MQNLINGLRAAAVERIIEKYEMACSPPACRDALKALPQANDFAGTALRIFLTGARRSEFPSGPEPPCG